MTDAYAGLTTAQMERAAVALAAAHGLPVRPLFEALRADDGLLHGILRQLRCVRIHKSINESLSAMGEPVEEAVQRGRQAPHPHSQVLVLLTIMYSQVVLASPRSVTWTAGEQRGRRGQVRRARAAGAKEDGAHVGCAL